MMLLRMIVPLALAVLAAGCATTGPDSTAQVTDSAGVRVITSTGVDAPLPWRFLEEQRIGGEDSGASSFTAASPALVRTNGVDRITVLDRDRSRVEVFDDTGQHLATLGGPGGGPGEFGLAFELLDAGPDVVGLFDFAKRAVVRWSPDGAILPERRLAEDHGAWNGMVLRGDTTIIGLDESDSLRTFHRVAVQTPGDTTVLDTLVAPPRGMAEFDCFAAQLPPMFAPRLTWQVHRDRVAITKQAEYRIDVFEQGQRVASIRRTIDPVPTTPEAANRMYPDGWSVNFQGGGRCTIEGSEVAAKAGMADFLPAVAEVGFGPDETLWVRRHTFPGEPPVTDVFDATGAYLGTIAGRGLPLGWLGPDRILFPIEDEATGISVVGIFRIDRTTGEGEATS